ncbi:MAG: hypothetical protein B6D44_01190, partial [Ignavibacteriales bacterium UTCHB2]
MTSPLISVIFITYKRIDLLKRTYESFLANTDYPREKLELILCDDGSPEPIQAEMKKLKFDRYLLANKNEGMAKNVNKGIVAASEKYILQLQDDWLCKGPSDYLRLGVKALEENPELGLIRYRMGMEYLCTSKSFNNGLNEIHILNRDQKDKIKRKYYRKDTFLYSDNPHLKRKEVHDKIGLYKSYKTMPQTELDFCLRFNNSNMYKVCYIAGFEEVFEHIGELQSNR